MAYDKLIITDFETTGLDPQQHEIIEIGAICVNAVSLDTLWEYNRFLLPSRIETAQPKALEINGYHEDVWRAGGALNFYDGMLEFCTRLDHTMIFIGQNVWFDVGFYLAGIDRLGWKDVLDPTPHGYSYHRLDIASMAWPFQKEPVYRMTQLSETFGVEPEPKPHRAINGVRNELNLLREIRRRGLQWVNMFSPKVWPK
jgi:DNA polymerase III alpha subunit (gram-positive type)